MLFLAQQEHADAKSTYDEALANYRTATDQLTIDNYHSQGETALEDINSAKDKALMFSILAGGVYAWQFIDAWIWGGGKRPVSGKFSSTNQIEPYASFDDQNVKIGLKLTWGGKR